MRLTQQVMHAGHPIGVRRQGRASVISVIDVATPNGVRTAKGVRPNLSTGDAGTRSTFSNHLHTV